FKPADRLLIEGNYPGAGKLPLTVGRDGSGVVDACGAGVSLREDDAVVLLRGNVGITRNGTLAEFFVAPEESLAKLPAGWSFEEGACSLVYLTAWKSLVSQGNYREGETVLVTGSSGGVGIAAVQLAAALGARVVALSRDAVKRRRLEDHGARHTIDAAADDLVQAVRNALDGGGFDIAVENLGGKFLEANVRLANLNGRIMVVGLLAGRKATPDLGPLLFNQVRIEGVHVGKYSAADARAAWASVVEVLSRAGQRPVIDRAFPLEAAPEAFDHLAGAHFGKVLVEAGA
ncbi:MAG: zinc-binding dehydrogenase, partial [Candidatus Hydrogenedentales bacterium]